MDPLSVITADVECISYDCTHKLMKTINLHKGYICYFLNVRSIKKHWDEVKVLNSMLNDGGRVLGCMVAEVSVKSSELHPYRLPGFSLFHKLREKQRGGGVMFFLREGISATVVDLEFDESESIILKIDNDSTTILLICIYRPPHTNKKDFLISLEYFLQGRQDKKLFLLVILT